MALRVRLKTGINRNPPESTGINRNQNQVYRNHTLNLRNQLPENRNQPKSTKINIKCTSNPLISTAIHVNYAFVGDNGRRAVAAPSVVTSADGVTAVPVTPRTARKPGQRSRPRATRAKSTRPTRGRRMDVE